MFLILTSPERERTGPGSGIEDTEIYGAWMQFCPGGELIVKACGGPSCTPSISHRTEMGRRA